MDQIITVSLKFMPASENKDIDKHVGKAISIIAKWGFKYEVGPSNTTVEGKLDDILKKVNDLCAEMEKDLERFVLQLDIDYKKSGVTIEHKVNKYRKK